METAEYAKRMPRFEILHNPRCAAARRLAPCEDRSRGLPDTD
jgi:hypothetical protein